MGYFITASKRFYEVSEFCYYALANGVGALLSRISPKKEKPRPKPAHKNYGQILGEKTGNILMVISPCPILKIPPESAISNLKPKVGRSARKDAKSQRF